MFEPMKALLQRKPNCCWTAVHAAQTRSWVISEPWTQKRLYDMKWADSKKCKGCHEEGADKHRLFHCKALEEERVNMQDVVRWCEMKARS